MESLKAFVAVLVIGPALDFCWFSLAASDLYKRELGPVLKARPDLGPAAVVYALIAILVAFFVMPKASSAGAAFLWGALAGLVVYGVYDFTNLSFLKDWTWTVTLIDVAWGMAMCGAVSAAAFWLKSL